MARLSKVKVTLIVDPEMVFEGPAFEALVAAVADRLAPTEPGESAVPDEKDRMRAIAAATRAREAGVA